jgi:serine/threonine protein phosphatase PrpC
VKKILHIIPGNAQNIGNRAEQQDEFGFSQLDDQRFIEYGGILAVVADGMGGLALGREAARAAKHTMLAHYQEAVRQMPVPEALEAALQEANRAVLALSLEKAREGEVGTTLVAAVVKDRQLYWVSVGDSRIYLWRRGIMYQLTTDHDYGRELARQAQAGELGWEEALGHSQREALTSYLGLRELPEVHRSTTPMPLAPGDRILLCSDGLYRALSPEEMAGVLAAASPQEAAEALVAQALAKRNPHQDNITVAILACEEGGTLRGFSRWRRGWGLALAAGLAGVLVGGSGVWLARSHWPPAAETKEVQPQAQAPADPAPPQPPPSPVAATPPAAPAAPPPPAFTPPVSSRVAAPPPSSPEDDPAPRTISGRASPHRQPPQPVSSKAAGKAVKTKEAKKKAGPPAEKP